MLNKILNSQSKTVTFAAILVALSAVISAILGLVRDRLLAGTFGAGEELDIYFAAFRIPDFVYGILITGGISAVFLPVFSEYFAKSREEAWKLANNILNCFFVLLVFLCGILAILAPWLADFIVPGFSSANKALMVSLARIMFLSPILFGLSSIFSGILHYFNRFLVYSLAPILYNLGIIFGILFLVPIYGLFGLAYGVISGAALYLIIQIIPAKNSGYFWRPVFNFRHLGLLKIFTLMVPRTIGTAAYNINLIIITAIASTLAAGSIAIFNFSNNLQSFPVTFIGVSFALASFPALSQSWANGQKEKFLENFSSVFRQILFLIVPLSILLFLLRAQIVRLILGTGNFGWWETRLTAASLGLFAFGIVAFAFIPFLARVFYSFQDTKTPVAVSLFSVAVNIILSFIFVKLLSFSNIFHDAAINILKLQGIDAVAIIGLPLAVSFSGILQFSLLLYFLRKKLRELALKEIWASFVKIAASSFLMALCVYAAIRLTAVFFNMQTVFGVASQLVFSGLVGVFVYILSAILLRSSEVKIIRFSVLTQFNRDAKPE